MPKLRSGSQLLTRVGGDHASVDAFQWIYGGA